MTPSLRYQSWPGVLHGGVVTALLDETIGRVAFLYDRWVQTAQLSVRFKKPAPLGEPLVARGRLVADKRRLLQMSGELTLVSSGELLAEASGTFVPLPEAARKAIAGRLGSDFEAWERWLAETRANS